MYWRIPGYLSASDLQGVVSVLSEQLASGAAPLEEEENESQKEVTNGEEFPKQVSPAALTLVDTGLDSSVGDMEGEYCNPQQCEPVWLSTNGK